MIRWNNAFCNNIFTAHSFIFSILFLSVAVILCIFCCFMGPSFFFFGGGGCCRPLDMAFDYPLELWLWLRFLWVLLSLNFVIYWKRIHIFSSSFLEKNTFHTMPIWTSFFFLISRYWNIGHSWRFSYLCDYNGCIERFHTHFDNSLLKFHLLNVRNLLRSSKCWHSNNLRRFLIETKIVPWVLKDNT